MLRSGNSDSRRATTWPMVSGGSSTGSDWVSAAEAARLAPSTIVSPTSDPLFSFQERQFELPDLKLVPVGKPVALDALTIDVSAVQAVQILHPELVLVVQYPGVMPGNGYVVEEEIAVRTAPDGEDVAA